MRALRLPDRSRSLVGVLSQVELAAVRAALVPAVLAGELLVQHNADQGEAFFILAGAFAAWAIGILSLHIAARAGRVQVPLALEHAEPFVDLAAIVALTYTSGGPFSQTGMAFFVLPLIASASLQPRATAAWCAASVAAYAALSLLHQTAGQSNATWRMVSQLAYLACAGLAATLLSVTLARRNAAIAALAEERGALAAHALSAEQRERRRLADVLHDESVQTLLLAQQELGDYRRTGREESLERARAAIAEAVSQLRGEILDLHPYLLDHAGLATALRSIADRWGQRIGARLTVAVDPAATGPHDDLVVVLARELLANAAKHSGAANVALEVTAADNHVELEVRDDGVGFDAGRRAAALRDGHIGLASAERRVQAVGGELTVVSGRDVGTTVRVTLPAAASPQRVVRSDQPRIVHTFI